MRLYLVSLAAFGFGVAQAQEPAAIRKPLATPQVQRLIAQLGSRDFKEREQASRELSTEGDRALPHLKAALLQSEAPEVQRRLEVLIDRLNSERVFSPSRVSADFKNASVKTILKDLCKQAGYEYRDGGSPDRRIALKHADVPFWEAMDAVSDATGLVVVAQDDERKTISAYNNESVSPYNFVNGPFKFTATNINCSRGIQLSNLPRRGQPSNPEYIGMSLQIFAEPKMPIVGLGAATVLKAVDDKGVSLIPPNGADGNEDRRGVRQYVPNSFRSLNQTCGLSLQRGSREATSIKELHAKVAVAILVEERPEITIENILEAKKKKFAGNDLELEVEEVVEAMGTVTLKLTFRQRETDPNDYSWYNTAVQRLILLDDKGSKMTSNGVNEQTNGVGVVTMRIGFAPPPGKKAAKPAKLVLLEWISETREIEFKFKNIPLP